MILYKGQVVNSIVSVVAEVYTRTSCILYKMYLKFFQTPGYQTFFFGSELLNVHSQKFNNLV